jgi:hypothetical protein
MGAGISILLAAGFGNVSGEVLFGVFFALVLLMVWESKILIPDTKAQFLKG